MNFEKRKRELFEKRKRELELASNIFGAPFILMGFLLEKESKIRCWVDKVIAKIKIVIKEKKIPIITLFSLIMAIVMLVDRGLLLTMIIYELIIIVIFAIKIIVIIFLYSILLLLLLEYSASSWARNQATAEKEKEEKIAEERVQREDRKKREAELQEHERQEKLAEIRVRENLKRLLSERFGTIQEYGRILGGYSGGKVYDRSGNFVGSYKNQKIYNENHCRVGEYNTDSMFIKIFRVSRGSYSQQVGYLRSDGAIRVGYGQDNAGYYRGPMEGAAAAAFLLHSKLHNYDETIYDSDDDDYTV